jgi:hypothetical protein
VGGYVDTETDEILLCAQGAMCAMQAPDGQRVETQ